MSQQAQIFVLKQGSMQKDHWSTRILTIDTETATATVSQKNHPSKVHYHTLRVNDVRKFPHVDLAHTKVDPNSADAKWTLCLLGNKAPVPDLNNEHVEAVAPYQKSNDAAAGEKQSSDSSDSNSNSNKHAKKSPKAHKKSGGEVFDHWLIRCTSQDTYDLAVKLLEQITHAKDKVPADRPHDASNPADKDLAIVPPRGGVMVMPASRAPVATA